MKSQKVVCSTSHGSQSIHCIADSVDQEAGESNIPVGYNLDPKPCNYHSNKFTSVKQHNGHRVELLSESKTRLKLGWTKIAYYIQMVGVRVRI